MTDFSTIASALSSLTGATEILKTIRGAGLALDAAEQKSRVADLVDKLADLKATLADLKVQTLEKDEKIRELEKKLRTHGEFEFDGVVYWAVKDGKKSGSHPFCARCFDADSKRIYLQSYGDDSWTCHNCKASPYRSTGAGKHHSAYDPFQD